jgi:CRP/FNR family transcriptional regulator, cyclic AMP receptor protein
MSSFNKPEIPAIGIVAGLEDQDRALLSSYGEFLPVKPEQQIVTEGQPQDSLYFVISGVLHVHTEVDKRTVLIARIEAGTTIGEVNAFDPGTASASVTAKEFSQVWKASKDDIDQFVTAYPEAGSRLLSGIIRCMSQRIRHMNDKLADQESLADVERWWH